MSKKHVPPAVAPGVTLGLLFSLVHCHSPASVGPASLATDSALGSATGNGSAPPELRPPRSSSTATTIASSPPPVVSSTGPGTSHNTASDLLDRLDAADLILFKRIEHDTKRDVPAVVRTLVASKHRGTARPALVSELNASVNDAKLRSQLHQWLDDSFGSAGAPNAATPGNSAGAGPSQVKPLRSK